MTSTSMTCTASHRCWPPSNMLKTPSASSSTSPPGRQSTETPACLARQHAAHQMPSACHHEIKHHETRLVELRERLHARRFLALEHCQKADLAGAHTITHCSDMDLAQTKKQIASSRAQGTTRGTTRGTTILAPAVPTAGLAPAINLRIGTRAVFQSIHIQSIRPTSMLLIIIPTTTTTTNRRTSLDLLYINSFQIGVVCSIQARHMD